MTLGLRRRAGCPPILQGRVATKAKLKMFTHLEIAMGEGSTDRRFAPDAGVLQELLANSSTIRYASSSWNCTGGDFMKYDDGPMRGPPRPRSRPIRAQRRASMMTPAELGES